MNEIALDNINEINKIGNDDDNKNDDDTINKHLWYPHECTRNAAFNIIYRAMFGKSLLLDDSKYNEWYRNTRTIFNNSLSALLYNELPLIIAKFLLSKQEQLFTNALKTTMNLTQMDVINRLKHERRDLSKAGQSLIDFIWQDYYNISINHDIDNNVNNNNGNINNSDILTYNFDDLDNITKERIYVDLTALLTGGLDTTGHTTEVGILLLAKYPNIQEIVYNELYNVYKRKAIQTQSHQHRSAHSILFSNDYNTQNNKTDEDKLNNNGIKFSLDKVNQCPQFRAFISETLRIACPLPDGVARTSSKPIRCVKFKPNTNTNTNTNTNNNANNTDNRNGKSKNNNSKKNRQKKKDKNSKKTQTDNSNSNEYEIICDYVDSKIWAKRENEILKSEWIKNNCYDYIIQPNTLIESNLSYLLQNKNDIWNKDNDPMCPNLNYWLKYQDNNNGYELESSSDKSRKDKKKRKRKLIYCKNNNSIPFSSGNRDCLGKTLAMKEISAFFGNIILNYQIIAPNNDPNSINIKYKTFGALTASVEPQIPVLVVKRQY